MSLVHSVANSIIEKLGRSFSLDRSIPAGAICREATTRSVRLLRGLIRLQSLVFLGPGVHIRNRRRVEFGKFCAVEGYSNLDGLSRAGIHIGAYSKLGRYVTVTGSSQMSKLGAGFFMGDRSGLGDFCHVGCSGGVTIGDDVIGGPFCSFHSQEHIFSDIDVVTREQGTNESAIIIGNNVWIGARSTFLAGSRVGDGSVVAAGSVVKGEFPPFSVIGGVPARILRMRSGE